MTLCSLLTCARPRAPARPRPRSERTLVPVRTQGRQVLRLPPLPGPDTLLAICLALYVHSPLALRLLLIVCTNNPAGIVWRPVFAIRGRYLLHRLSNIFYSAPVRRQRNLEWLEGLSKVGSNPFDLQVKYRTWAGKCFSSPPPSRARNAPAIACPRTLLKGFALQAPMIAISTCISATPRTRRYVSLHPRVRTHAS